MSVVRMKYGFHRLLSPCSGSALPRGSVVSLQGGRSGKYWLGYSSLNPRFTTRISIPVSGFLFLLLNVLDSGDAHIKSPGVEMGPSCSNPK